MLFPASNKVIASRLERKLTETDGQVLLFEDKLTEFGGCRYLLRSDAAEPAAVLVCIGFSVDTAREIDATHDEAVELLQEHCGSVATVLPDASSPYHFAVKVDIQALREMAPDQQKFWVQQVASLRLAIQGGPLKNWVLRWMDGRLEETLVPVYSSPEGYWYCRLGHQNLIATFPIRLQHFRDPVMLTALLQEFATCSELKGTGLPSSTFVAEKGKVPVELEQLPASELQDVDGGYLQFTIDRRHCTKDNVNEVVWQLLSCYLMLRYQSQLSKVSLHSQMRKRLSTVAEQLAQARRPQFDLATTSA